MHRYLNTRLVRRNSVIGKAMIIIGLATMAIALIISFSRPEEVNLLLILALGGTLLAQFGIAFHNRWGRSPRMDEVLDQALKGLDSRFASFHYVLGTKHALICPAGAFALVPRVEEGDIRYADGKWWRVKSTRGFLRRPGKKAIGIEEQARSEEETLKRKLQRLLPDQPDIPVRSILVFVSQNANVESKDTLPLTVHIKKLKNAVRRLPKEKSLEVDEIELLAKTIGY
jgi:hypothetical protein